ncbi:MAG: c-type cytochrome, methanol metabolism-related [Hyphomicrobium sp.]|uniref:c-type cytochrome, methanol metabolism-related n=1 Tax=Hyphomicrobium sp. TaxID=82 RepID=UPI0039E5EC9E
MKFFTNLAACAVVLGCVSSHTTSAAESSETAKSFSVADSAPNPDDPNAPPPGSRKADGDAVYSNPVSELAKTMPDVKFQDGRYRNKDSDPQPVVTKDYIVDWGTWNGFRRYHDACHVCHGPNALGSTFAPALAESLKTIDYNTFLATVSGGKRENRGGTDFVMPSFGEDKNIMCYIDDIYTYIKARSLGVLPPGRPNGREDISPEARKAADDCTG